VKRLPVLVAALGAALGLAACGGGDDSKGGGGKIAIRLTDKGCMPARLTVPAGWTTFAITNQGTTKATEFEVLKGSRVLAEKENVTEGIDAEVSLDLAPGRYSTFCGGGTPKGVLVATGKARRD
jgi:iron uptake system component EfeO